MLLLSFPLRHTTGHLPEKLDVFLSGDQTPNAAILLARTVLSLQIFWDMLIVVIK